MRSRGGILSSFPSLTCFSAIFMALPLDTGVTGQYLYRCYRSVPQAPRNVIFFLGAGPALTETRKEYHEMQSTFRVAAVGRAHPVGGRWRPDRRARCRSPAHPDRGPAAMAQP